MKNILNIFLVLSLTVGIVNESLSNDAFPLKIKVDLADSYSLNKRVFGIHGELLWSPVRVGDPQLSAMYNDVGFRDIRLPGGAAGNHFLSQQSKFGCNKTGPIGDKTKDRIKKYNRALSRKNRTYSTEDFLSFIKQASTDFTLIINVLCDTPENTRKWMQQIRDSGVTVKYAEMGSEYYFEEYLWAFPTPDEYIKQARQHATEVKRIFPDVKIGFDTSVSSYRSKNFPDFAKMARNQRFKRGLIYDKLAASEPMADALIMHVYSPFHATRSDMVLDEVEYGHVYKSAMSFFDGRLKPSFKYLHDLNPEKTIWITEWGTSFYGWKRKHEPDFIRSYYNALFVTNAMLTYFSIPYVESTNYHNFPYLWSDLKKQEPNPLYYALSLFNKSLLQSNTISALQLDGAMTFASEHPYYEGNLSELNAVFMHNNNNGYIFIVNKLARQYKLNSISVISGIENILPVEYEQIIPKKSGSPESDKIIKNKYVVAEGATIEIPPFSITRIQVNIEKEKVTNNQKEL